MPCRNVKTTPESSNMSIKINGKPSNENAVGIANHPVITIGLPAEQPQIGAQLPGLMAHRDVINYPRLRPHHGQVSRLNGSPIADGRSQAISKQLVCLFFTDSQLQGATNAQIARPKLGKETGKNPSYSLHFGKNGGKH